MGYTNLVKGTFRPNFLESEVGLVLKTYQIPASMGADDGTGRKVVAAGTPFPSDDTSAVGLVFEDVDVSWGDHAGSVLVAGRVLGNKLSVSGSKETLTGKGIVFVKTPSITRPWGVDE